MSGSWSRPYAPGRGRWWVIAWEAGALAYLHWTTTRMLGLNPPLTVALGVVLALVWLAGAWRIRRIGLYVGDRGLLVRNLLTTRIVPWGQVGHIVIEPVVHRLGAFAIPSGRCVLIQRADGARINTSLWEKGVDFHARPGLFREVYQSLRARHARSAYGGENTLTTAEAGSDEFAAG